MALRTLPSPTYSKRPIHFFSLLQPGFTLVEVMIVTAIIMVVTGGAISNFQGFNEKERVKQAMANLKTNFRVAQTKALSGEKPTIANDSACQTSDCTCQALVGYQVQFTSVSSYTTRALCNNGASDISVGSAQVVTLPNGVTFPSIFQTIIFYTGTKGISGSQTITLSSGSTIARVQVLASGLISDIGPSVTLTPAPTSTSTPITTSTSTPTPTSTSTPIPTATLSPTPTPDITTGLVGYWKLDETGGTTVAATAGGQNGTTTGTTVVNGQTGFGKARQLNGSTDSISFGDFSPADFGTSDFSIAFWMIKTTTRLEEIVTKRPTCNYGSFWSLRFSSTMSTELDQSNSGNYFPLNGSGVVSGGGWHHVVITRSGTTVKMYKDGAQDATGTSGSIISIANSTPLKIGVGPCDAPDPNTYHFTGTIDEFRIYSRALTAGQVSYLKSITPTP